MNDGFGTARAYPRVFLAAVLGMVFGLCLYPVWGLEGRWFVIVIVGIGLVSISMMFAGRFSEFLLILLIFCVPLAGFTMFPFPEGYPVEVKQGGAVSGTLSLGVVDFLVAGLYFAWAFRIFVLHEEPLPRLERIDVGVALVVLASALSVWGAQDPRLGLLALGGLLQHVLAYFYVSRHFRREHFSWFAASIMFAIAVEAALGLVQNRFGVVVGLILDKGAGGEELDYQYLVPGIEDVSRATGTTYDSHALGLYLAMLLPYALVFLYMRTVPSLLRLLSATLLLLGIAVLGVTYSRAAYLDCAFSIGVTVLVLLAWRDRYVFPSLVGAAIVGIATAPWVLAPLFGRLFDAPEGLITARFEQYPAAWSIWSENFLFGSGAGNYMVALYEHNMNWVGEGPVHNVPLFIGAEMGLFGIVAYYGLIAVVLHHLWSLFRLRRDPAARIALATFAGLLAYVFDGMSNPLFREPVVYMMFWVSLALAVALTRQVREEHPVPSLNSL